MYPDGKLVATMNNRMDGNFYCLKMVTAGALVGAIVGSVVAAGAVITGGTAIGGIVAAIGSGALVGSISGKLLSLMPCICACLTKPNRWTMVKDTVLLQNQKALMPDAKLNCLLGGMVSIILPQIEIVLDALALSNCAYNVDNEDSPRYKDNAEIPNGWTEIKDLEKEFGDEIAAVLINSQNGFKAKLFKNGDIYIFYMENKPAGYISLYKKEGIIEVRELFGLNKKVIESIYAFIKTYKEYYPEVIIKAPINSNMNFYIYNQTSMKKTEFPFIMGRIVNAENMLKRLHIEDMELKISVIDKIIEENNGIYEISVYGVVSKKDKKKSIESDIEIDIADLNHLIFGYFSIDEMIELERIKINNKEKIEEIKKIFPKRKVYLQEYQ